MAICRECERHGDRLRDELTIKERMHMISSVGSMGRFLESAPEDDKKANSSCLTKLILSFPREARETLMEHLSRSCGIPIRLDDCPHGPSLVT